MTTLAQLNAASAGDFVGLLAGIYEHSPWVAERCVSRRPFASRLDLLDAMQAVVTTAPLDDQLALIRAHPELAGKAAVRGELTAESTREQAGAGLGDCTQEEFDRLQALNQSYNQRFGFPFILAVRGHDRASIIAAFEARLAHDAATERCTALAQIGRIAMFRLLERTSEPLGSSIMAMAAKLARFSEEPGRLTCTFLSDAHRAAAQQLRDWMWAAGLDAHIDAIGNVIGRLACGHANARTLLTGSHYDTVVNGGSYDGRLGILLPLAVAEHLKRSGTRLAVDLEILGFSDEEGVRFDSTYLGSRAVAGSFDMALLERSDRDGVSMYQLLKRAGLDPNAIPRLARDPATLAGYVEVHIEQGPQLLSSQQPLGIVTAINGACRWLVEISGEAGHAGTVPMRLRHDAAAAAAELLLYVEQRCKQQADLVGTVGRLSVPGGAVNVIPGRCELSIDVRAPDDADRDAVMTDIAAAMQQIAQRRGVRFSHREVLRGPATPCDAALQDRLAAAVTAVTGNPAPPRLASGAGHDAVMMATLTPSAMLFVRCGNGGISHNPLETMLESDADIAAQTLLKFLTETP